MASDKSDEDTSDQKSPTAYARSKTVSMSFASGRTMIGAGVFYRIKMQAEQAAKASGQKRGGKATDSQKDAVEDKKDERRTRRRNVWKRSWPVSSAICSGDSGSADDASVSAARRGGILCDSRWRQGRTRRSPTSFLADGHRTARGAAPSRKRDLGRRVEGLRHGRRPGLCLPGGGLSVDLPGRVDRHRRDPCHPPYLVLRGATTESRVSGYKTHHVPEDMHKGSRSRRHGRQRDPDHHGRATARL